jgi:hypothetical protein
MSEKGLTFEIVPGFQHRHHKSPSDSYIYICLPGFLSFLNETGSVFSVSVFYVLERNATKPPDTRIFYIYPKPLFFQRRA